MRLCVKLPENDSSCPRNKARLLLEKETLTPEDFPPLAQSNEPSAKKKVEETF